MLHRFFAVAIACMLTSPVGARQVVAQSNFDAGLEGWSAVTFATLCGTLSNAGAPLNATWQSSGGATGGFIRTPDGANTTFWRAPASFRGNLGLAYGGSMKMEQRLATGDADIFYAIDDVYIQGGGITLIGNAPSCSRDSWGQTLVPLLPGYWRVGTCAGPLASEAEIRTALGNVQELYIRGEHVNGGETNDLDSVVIDAEPFNDSCIAFWQELDRQSPTGRWRHAIAVDTARQVLVLFGGDTGESDTWEFNLVTSTWTRTTPAISPTRRGGHAMAYDAARGVVVMTGGGYLGSFAEVWEYNVATDQWTQSTPLPQARAGHCMAYDTARNTLVLYGGLSAGATGAVDVMERSSASSQWISRPSDVNPGPQIGYAMAYDAARGRSVLVGEGTTAVSVAEWDGAAGIWALRSFSGTVPGARQNPALAYDVQRSRIVLMGGEAGSNVWDYDGTAWTQRANIPGGGRDEHAAAYDPVHARVLLSGGILNNASAVRDLLGFNGTANTWSTVWTSPSCSARDLLAMAYDEVGQRTMLYGGGLLTRAGIVQQVSGGTFEFQNDTWTLLSPSVTPGGRWIHSLVYDSINRSLLLYGGRTGSGQNTASSRLWHFDLATSVWTDRGVQPPGQRTNQGAAFDRARGTMVIHGGNNEVGELIGGTWIYDSANNAWTSVQDPTPNPGIRTGASMVFDERRSVVVLFGGIAGASGTYSNETWEWDGAAWHNVTPAMGNPPARVQPRMVYDPVRRSVVMFAGRMNFNSTTNSSFSGRAYGDLWEWTGSAWRRLVLNTAIMPTALCEGGAVYDRAEGGIVHFGGASITNGTYRNGQTWRMLLPEPGCGGVGCPADFDGTGFVDTDDFTAFVTAFEAGDSSADFDGTGFVDTDDFTSFVLAFESGC